MLIDFDKGKDLVNLGKHGLSLALAAEVDWEHALAWADKRRGYREVRMIAIAPSTGILYYIAFVDRDQTRRVISLRKANRREVKHYAENF